MKGLVIGLIGCLLVALACGPAGAWSHSGAFGSASGGGGSWSGSGFRGGSASGGEGSWSGHGAFGGSASGGGGSWSASGASGTTAYYSSAYSTTAYHTTTSGTTAYYGGTYATYHPPTTVNYYGSSCYNCGGWSTAGAAAAGAVVGVVAGATVASANTAAATSSACSAGYAAGAANTAYAMGAIYATLPSQPAASSPRSTAQPTTTAARHGSSQPMVRTASTIVECLRPEGARTCAARVSDERHTEDLLDRTIRLHTVPAHAWRAGGGFAG